MQNERKIENIHVSTFENCAIQYLVVSADMFSEHFSRTTSFKIPMNSILFNDDVVETHLKNKELIEVEIDNEDSNRVTLHLFSILDKCENLLNKYGSLVYLKHAEAFIFLSKDKLIKDEKYLNLYTKQSNAKRAIGSKGIILDSMLRSIYGKTSRMFQHICLKYSDRTVKYYTKNIE